MKKWMYLGIATALVLALAGLGLAFRPALFPTMAAPRLEPTAQTQGGAWLGVQLGDLNAKLAQRLGLSRQQGVVVLRVLPQTPAAQAGLQVKDVILEVNGQGVSQAAKVSDAIKQAKPGDKLTLKISRGAEERSLEVTLGTSPAPTTPGPIAPRMRPNLAPFGGYFKDKLGNLDNLGQSFLGGQFSFKDKDGKTVIFVVTPGAIASVGSDSISLTLNDGGSKTFKVTPDTKIAKGGKAVALSDLKAGEQVVIVGTQSETADLIIERGQVGTAPQPFGHRFGQPRQGQSQKPPQPSVTPSAASA